MLNIDINEINQWFVEGIEDAIRTIQEESGKESYFLPYVTAMMEERRKLIEQISAVQEKVDEIRSSVSTSLGKG